MQANQKQWRYGLRLALLGLTALWGLVAALTLFEIGPVSYTAHAVTVNSEMTTTKVQDGVRTKQRTVTITASEKGAFAIYRVGTRSVNISVSPPNYLYKTDVVCTGPAMVISHVTTSCIADNPAGAQSKLASMYAAGGATFVNLVQDNQTALIGGGGNRRLLQFDPGSFAIATTALVITLENQGRIKKLENTTNYHTQQITNLTNAFNALDDNVMILKNTTKALAEVTQRVDDNVSTLKGAMKDTQDQIERLWKQNNATITEMVNQRNDTIVKINELQDNVKQVRDQMVADVGKLSVQVQDALNTVFQNLQTSASDQSKSLDAVISLVENVQDSVYTLAFVVQREYKNPTIRRSLSLMYHATRKLLDLGKFFTMTRDIGASPNGLGEQLTGTDSRVIVDTIYYAWSTPTGGTPPFASNSRRMKIFINSNLGIDYYNAGATIREHLSRLGPANCVPPVLSGGFVVSETLDAGFTACYSWIEVREAACGTNTNTPWFTARPIPDGVDGLLSTPGKCRNDVLTSSANIVIRSEQEFNDYLTNFCKSLSYFPAGDNGIFMSLAMAGWQRLANNATGWCDMSFRQLMNENLRRNYSTVVDVKATTFALLEEVMPKAGEALTQAEINRYGTLPSSVEVEVQPMASAPAFVDKNGRSTVDAYTQPEACYTSRWVDTSYDVLPVVSVSPFEPFFRQKVSVTWSDTGESVISSDVLSTIVAAPLLPKSTLMVGHPADIPTNKYLYDMPEGSICVSPELSLRVNRYPYCLMPKDTKRMQNFSYFWDMYGVDFKPGVHGRVTPHKSVVPTANDVRGSPYCVTDYKNMYAGDFDYGPASATLRTRCTSHGAFSPGDTVANWPSTLSALTNNAHALNTVTNSLVSSIFTLPGYVRFVFGFWYNEGSFVPSSTPTVNTVCNSSLGIVFGMVNGYPTMRFGSWDFESDVLSTTIRIQFPPLNDNTAHYVSWVFTLGTQPSLRLWVDDTDLGAVTMTEAQLNEIANGWPLTCYNSPVFRLPFLFVAPTAPVSASDAFTMSAYYRLGAYLIGSTLVASQPLCTGSSFASTIASLSWYRIPKTVPTCQAQREEVSDPADYVVDSQTPIVRRARLGLLNVESQPGGLGFYLSSTTGLNTFSAYACNSGAVFPNGAYPTTAQFQSNGCWAATVSSNGQFCTAVFTDHTTATSSNRTATCPSLNAIRYGMIMFRSGTTDFYIDGVLFFSRGSPSYGPSTKDVFLNRGYGPVATVATGAKQVMRRSSAVWAYPSGGNAILTASSARAELTCMHVNTSPLSPVGDFAACRATLSSGSTTVLSCRSPTYCNGHCTIYGSPQNTVGNTVLNVISRECDAGYEGTMCTSRCARIHPDTGECVAPAFYNETRYGSGEIPSGTWCPLLKYFSMTTDSSRSVMYLQPRQWSVQFTINMPLVGDIEEDVSSNACPQIKLTTLLNGRQQLVLSNTVSTSPLLTRIKYAPNPNATQPPSQSACTGTEDVNVSPTGDYVFVMPICGQLIVTVQQMNQVTRVPIGDCQSVQAYSSEAPMSMRLETTPSADFQNAVSVAVRSSTQLVQELVGWVQVSLLQVLNATGAMAPGLRASLAEDAARFSNISSIVNMSNYLYLDKPITWDSGSDTRFTEFVNQSRTAVEQGLEDAKKIEAAVKAVEQNEKYIKDGFVGIFLALNNITSKRLNMTPADLLDGSGGIDIGSLTSGVADVMEKFGDGVVTVAEGAASVADKAISAVTGGIGSLLGSVFGVASSLIYVVLVGGVVLLILYCAWNGGAFDSCLGGQQQCCKCCQHLLQQPGQYQPIPSDNGPGPSATPMSQASSVAASVRSGATAAASAVPGGGGIGGMFRRMVKKTPAAPQQAQSGAKVAVPRSSNAKSKSDSLTHRGRFAWPQSQSLYDLGEDDSEE
jgi:hypothetical protein